MKIVVLLVGLALSTAAVAMGMRSSAPVAGPATQPVNKMCAVNRDHPVDPTVTIVYKDKVIGFCCEDCIPEFKKDPEKFMKDLK